MTLTLDEAIKHAEEVAEKKERDLKVYESLNEDRPLFTEEENECKECAKEHRQLAEWLKELKSYKENKDIISIFDGATNEDVLRKVFPNFEEDITPKGDTLILERYTPYCKMQLHKDWLDAPYKGGKE